MLVLFIDLIALLVSYSFRYHFFKLIPSEKSIMLVVFTRMYKFACHAKMTYRDNKEQPRVARLRPSPPPSIAGNWMISLNIHYDCDSQTFGRHKTIGTKIFIQIM